MLFEVVWEENEENDAWNLATVEEKIEVALLRRLCGKRTKRTRLGTWRRSRSNTLNYPHTDNRDFKFQVTERRRSTTKG
jgi:hypothetical protein